MEEYNNIPDEMKQLKNWLVWRLVDKGGEKPSKVPFSVSGSSASVSNPNTWGTFKSAVAAYETGEYDGIGFVFTDTPFVGIDIDGCVNTETGEISAAASDIIGTTQSYTELSQSGKGFHIILRGALPQGRRRKGSFEMYGSGSPRYFAMTGKVWEGRRQIAENQAAINRVHKKYIEPPKPDAPKPTGVELMPDEEVIARATTNAKTGGAFLALYDGNWQGKYNSQSEADQALCNYLAFWTGCNAEQMDRLFRSGGLMRSKWDELHGSVTYGEMTIQRACGDCREVYSPDYKKQELKTFDLPVAIRADELQKMVLPDICWLWDSMLTTGLSLFVGASKIGKSWFALQLALAVSAGTDFLGKKTKGCKTLYLALEDSRRRLQSRMNKLLGSVVASRNLEYLTESPLMGNGLIEVLEHYAKEGFSLIIIDTLQKIRGTSSSNKNAFAADYEDMGILKRFADKNDIAILLVHHTRKMKDDDVFNMISGTNALMAAADTIMILSKEKRKDNQAYLHITGRDVMNDILVIEKDRRTGYGWSYVGKKDDVEEMAEVQRYNNSPIVMTIRELLKENGTWSGTATELSTAIKEYQGEELDVAHLGRKLRELQPELLTRDNIVYITPTGCTSKRVHGFRFDEPLCI